MKRLITLFSMIACCQPMTAQPVRQSNPRFERIDAHAHVFNTAPEFAALLERLNLRILNICVVDKHDPGFEEVEPQHAKALEVFRATDGRAAWWATWPNAARDRGSRTLPGRAVAQTTARHPA